MSGHGREALAVARVMTKAALLEQTAMSGSTAMIFLTLVTARGVSRSREGSQRARSLTGQLSLARHLLPGRDCRGVVRHLNPTGREVRVLRRLTMGAVPIMGSGGLWGGVTGVELVGMAL